MNLDYAIGSKKMLDEMTKDVIKDNQSLAPVVTVDNYEACRKYFRIIDFWNEQICKGMGWKYNG